jgi:hypothetical protein
MNDITIVEFSQVSVREERDVYTKRNLYFVLK